VAAAAEGGATALVIVAVEETRGTGLRIPLGVSAAAPDETCDDDDDDDEGACRAAPFDATAAANKEPAI